MNNKIIINNEVIANYIMFKLDKIDNIFTQKELETIQELVIDYNEINQSSFIFLQELLKLPNLTHLTLRNAYIYNDNYHIFLKLNNLIDITFDNCIFENADLIGSLSLEALSIINCNNINVSFLNILSNLKELTIINNDIDINIINNLNNLTYLQLSNCTIDNINSISLNNLSILYIDNTNISNLDFIDNLNKLTNLVLDIKQYNSNKYIFNNYPNISFSYENLIELGDDNNE